MELTPEELKKKQLRRIRSKEAKKNRRRLIITFAENKTSFSYSTLSDQELEVAKNLIITALEHRGTTKPTFLGLSCDDKRKEVKEILETIPTPNKKKEKGGKKTSKK